MGWARSFSVLTVLFASLNAAQAQQFERYEEGGSLSYPDLLNLQQSFKEVQATSVPESISPNAPVIDLDPSLMDPRIVGGQITTIDSSPWQVALVFNSAPEPIRVLYCGGSLIAPNWVLTAAHCADSDNVLDVVAQTTFYKYLGNRVGVDKKFIHPGWNKMTNENDVALLKLKSALPQTTNIALVNPMIVIPDGTKLTVTGWGAIFEGGPTSDVLRLANLPLVSNGICNSAGSYNGRIKSGMMCAGYRDGGLDSCQGDSGGPASTKIDGVPTLVGVVSWGEGCARRLKYGVYARLTTYSDWIKTTLQAN